MSYRYHENDAGNLESAPIHLQMTQVKRDAFCIRLQPLLLLLLLLFFIHSCKLSQELVRFPLRLTLRSWGRR